MVTYSVVARFFDLHLDFTEPYLEESMQDVEIALPWIGRSGEKWQASVSKRFRRTMINRGCPTLRVPSLRIQMTKSSVT